MGRRKEVNGVSGRVFSVCDASAVEEEGVVGVGMVRHEHEQAEVVGQDVGEFPAIAGMLVHPFPAGLLGLIPTDREAHRLVDDLGGVAGLNGDDLKNLAERAGGGRCPPARREGRSGRVSWGRGWGL